jgi:excisionase family DNA binding protein
MLTEIPATVTVAAAAERLAVSERTVRRMIARGQLAAVRHGHEWAIPLRALNGHGQIDGRTVTPTATVAGCPTTATDTRTVAALVAMLQDLQTRLAEAQAETTAKAEAAALWQGRAGVLADELEHARRQLALPAPKARPWWAWWAFWRGA